MHLHGLAGDGLAERVELARGPAAHLLDVVSPGLDERRHRPVSHPLDRELRVDPEEIAEVEVHVDELARGRGRPRLDERALERDDHDRVPPAAVGGARLLEEELQPVARPAVVLGRRVPLAPLRGLSSAALARLLDGAAHRVSPHRLPQLREPPPDRGDEPPRLFLHAEVGCATLLGLPAGVEPEDLVERLRVVGRGRRQRRRRELREICAWLAGGRRRPRREEQRGEQDSSDEARRHTPCLAGGAASAHESRTRPEAPRHPGEPGAGAPRRGASSRRAARPRLAHAPRSGDSSPRARLTRAARRVKSPPSDARPHRLLRRLPRHGLRDVFRDRAARQARGAALLHHRTRELPRHDRGRVLPRRRARRRGRVPRAHDRRRGRRGVLSGRAHAPRALWPGHRDRRRRHRDEGRRVLGGPGRGRARRLRQAPREGQGRRRDPGLHVELRDGPRLGDAPRLLSPRGGWQLQAQIRGRGDEREGRRDAGRAAGVVAGLARRARRGRAPLVRALAPRRAATTRTRAPQRR